MDVKPMYHELGQKRANYFFQKLRSCAIGDNFLVVQAKGVPKLVLNVYQNQA